jgi:hypothetical protein
MGRLQYNHQQVQQHMRLGQYYIHRDGVQQQTPLSITVFSRLCGCCNYSAWCWWCVPRFKLSTELPSTKPAH